MNKEEFLRTLGEALAGEVPQNIIQENIRYYNNYISGELAKGRTESEIIDELGGPRIVARTIIDAAEAGGEVYGDGSYSSGSGSESYGAGGYGSGAYGQNGYGSPMEENSPNQRGFFHVYNMNTWYWRLAGILILALVIFLLITIIGGIAAFLLSPIGLILIILWLLWWSQR